MASILHNLNNKYLQSLLKALKTMKMVKTKLTDEDMLIIMKYITSITMF